MVAGARGTIGGRFARERAPGRNRIHAGLEAGIQGMGADEVLVNAHGLSQSVGMFAVSSNCRATSNANDAGTSIAMVCA